MAEMFPSSNLTNESAAYLSFQNGSGGAIAIRKHWKPKHMLANSAIIIGKKF
jgi:hypothetical protein